MSDETIRTFERLRAICRNFAGGKLPAVMLVGPPGQCKSETLRQELGERGYLTIRGKTSGVKLFEELYEYRGLPVLFDDTSPLFNNLDVQEMLRDLTETTALKKIYWRTQNKYLEERGLPNVFQTTSPVCVLANRHGSGGVWDALESRLHKWNVEFNWDELCNEVERVGWFKDKQILKYARIHATCTPDVRLLTKAKDRKGCKDVGDWRHVFGVDPGKRSAEDFVRELLRDRALKTGDREQIFINEGLGSPATFHRILAGLRTGSLTETNCSLVARKKKEKTNTRADATTSARRQCTKSRAESSSRSGKKVAARGRRGAA